MLRVARGTHTLWTWLIWDDAWLMTRFATKNVAPTKEDRQHVTNCKVNIISGLPQEMAARIEGIATQFAGKEKPPLR